MVTLSLDTSVLVELLRGKSHDIRDRYDQTVLAGGSMVVSALVIHELLTGANGSARPARQIALVDRMLNDLPRVDFTAEDALVSSRAQASLNRRGRPIGDVDTLIAGQALARGWVVVTRNVRHFGEVEGLAIADWSVSDDPLTAHQIAERLSAGR